MAKTYPFLVVSHEIIDAATRQVGPGKIVSRHSRQDLARNGLDRAVRRGLTGAPGNACRIVTDADCVTAPDPNEASTAWWIGGTKAVRVGGCFSLTKIARRLQGTLVVVAPKMVSESTS